VSFLDDFSRYTWLFPIACKSDVYTIFNQFKLYVERYFSCSIKSVQSDWGGKYRSLSKILQHHGITHRLSCPHTHQQNGAIERKHRHIVETSLALLSFASVPRQYWDDAFVTACYLINRMPTPLLKNQSPFELLFKTPPDYKILHIFGCACWPHLRPYNSNKLQPRSLQCVFLGYSLRHKGYKCLHLPTGHVYFSRDVLFQEDIFPFATTPSHSSPPTVNSPPTHPREPSIILPPTAPTHPRATV
jgi:transposase InsO family protein